MDRLKVSANSRFLIHENGEPFFWLGDTGWLLFSRLNKAEAEHYLETRRKQGFNVIQVMGVHQLPQSNIYGHQPFRGTDVSQPLKAAGAGGEGYWDHVDYIIDLAAAKGLYVAFVPIWGTEVKAGKVSEVQARAYGRWLGKRYKDKPNIIWLNGGDIQGTVQGQVWQALAEAIKAEDPHHLMTFHPFGRTCSSAWFHTCDWLDFNMFQSGHRRYDQGGPDGDSSFGEDNWRYVEAGYKLEPAKPIIDGEPSYEQIPQGLHDPAEPRWQAQDVRRYAYWSVFAGAFGHTYGHNSVIQMYRIGDLNPSYGPIDPWDEAINAPGADQMRHLKNLLMAYPFFTRIPDQSALLGPPGERYQRVAITRGLDYLLAYTYLGQSFKLRLGIIAGDEIKAAWYDPRTGDRIDQGVLANRDLAQFDPPSNSEDWVLVLESLGGLTHGTN